MKTLNDCMNEYQRQVEEGTIKKAYQGLMEYIMNLKNYLKSKYPNYQISGSIYYGYMDMTYFSFTPESLKSKKLKIAVVFIHEKACFKVWLSGVNKKVQSKYWKLFKESNWDKYYMPSDIKSVDYIIENNLIEKPNFNKLDTLTSQIEVEVLKFIEDIENFLDSK